MKRQNKQILFIILCILIIGMVIIVPVLNKQVGNVYIKFNEQCKRLNRTIETIGVLEKKRKQDELFTLNDYHIKLWMQKNIAIITVKLKDKSIISVETY